MQPLKPFVRITDSDGNSHVLELDTAHRHTGTDKVLVLSGKLNLKSGGEVAVKTVRAMKWPFLGKHVRITGNCTTTPEEIAKQLNELFAEE